MWPTCVWINLAVLASACSGPGEGLRSELIKAKATYVATRGMTLADYLAVCYILLVVKDRINGSERVPTHHHCSMEKPAVILPRFLRADPLQVSVSSCSSGSKNWDRQHKYTPHRSQVSQQPPMQDWFLMISLQQCLAVSSEFSVLLRLHTVFQLQTSVGDSPFRQILSSANMYTEIDCLACLRVFKNFVQLTSLVFLWHCAKRANCRPLLCAFFQGYV